VSPGSELFLNIRVHPAADLSRLEEVLVVTKIDEKQAEPDPTSAARAVDILAERLPGVPSKPEGAEKNGVPSTAAPGAAATTTGAIPADVPAKVTPTSPGPDAKPPKPLAPQASASGSAPPAGYPAAHPANKATASAADASKVSPKPVKSTVQPKLQPAVEDRPH
jgi:hypothetical protein